MIPITSEEEWLLSLKALPAWEPPSLPTIVLSPHPDDETLGAGGLIADLRQQNIEVKIIAITDGENAYSDTKKLGLLRKKEQEKALQKLGISQENIIRLHLTDSAVQAREEELASLILPLVHSNVHLLAPWTGDFHPDHKSVGNVAVKIANLTGVILNFYFFWTWHQERFSTIQHLPLGVYPLRSCAIESKKAALDCYRSQLAHPSKKPILTPRLLAPAKRHFEVFCRYE